MAKRIIVSVLGLLSLFAGLMAFIYALEVFRDFWNPEVSFWSNAIGELIVSGTALTASILGVRFLLFAFRGRESRQKDSLRRAILLGIGFFFPGFVFSLPFTTLWALHTWPGDGQSELAAISVSVFVGATSAITCLVVLLRRRKFQHT